VRSNKPQVYHNLATMLGAGVPLLRSLETSVSGLDGRLARAMRAVAERTSQGEPLAAAMARYPKAFGRLDVLSVEAAELTGKLAETFANLARWYEFRRRMRRKIVTGLVLPILLLHMAAAIAPLPRLLLGQIEPRGYLAAVLQGVSLFYVPAAAWLLIKRTPQTGPLRTLLDLVTLRVPVLGKAVYYLALARYTRTFHAMLTAGVPIDKCAEVATEVTGNAGVRRLVRGALDAIRDGRDASEGFSHRLEGQFLGMWQVGEQGGKLDEATERLAANMSTLAEEWFGHFATWFPRLIYALVSAFIAWQILKVAQTVLPF